MVSLITKADIENELQATLPSGYGDASGNVITGICNWAHSYLRLKTNRTSFSGDASDIAKMAEIYLAIDRLTTSHPELAKLAISSISENGASITFSNGKTIEEYHLGTERIIADLRISDRYSNSLTFPDVDGTHMGSEGSILY